MLVFKKNKNGESIMLMTMKCGFFLLDLYGEYFAINILNFMNIAIHVCG